MVYGAGRTANESSFVGVRVRGVFVGSIVGVSVGVRVEEEDFLLLFFIFLVIALGIPANKHRAAKRMGVTLLVPNMVTCVGM